MASAPKGLSTPPGHCSQMKRSTDEGRRHQDQQQGSPPRGPHTDQHQGPPPQGPRTSLQQGPPPRGPPTRWQQGPSPSQGPPTASPPGRLVSAANPGVQAAAAPQGPKTPSRHTQSAQTTTLVEENWSQKEAPVCTHPGKPACPPGPPPGALGKYLPPHGGSPRLPAPQPAPQPGSQGWGPPPASPHRQPPAQPTNVCGWATNAQSQPNAASASETLRPPRGRGGGQGAEGRSFSSVWLFQ
ncbi:basic salivary proline-rich protein 2-like [Canis lupus familiaris]|uniref:basic salivary proline-rich protein 2-like n=1 Tax=Canis lupus familiaris TaxID=9615 RepID=UPI0003ADD7AA|nr:basic salivary proline-rich protein 2-like [Canis lupus familiaris]|eukprot:XP_005628358.1 basic salivary proline-rich protein 2-like [Canis lupus familiaris]